MKRNVKLRLFFNRKITELTDNNKKIIIKVTQHVIGGFKWSGFEHTEFIGFTSMLLSGNCYYKIYKKKINLESYWELKHIDKTEAITLELKDEPYIKVYKDKTIIKNYSYEKLF